MAFTIQSFRDLVRLLEERPEWRAELRRLVLTEELLALPDIVRELAEAQRRTEQMLQALIQRADGVEHGLGRVEHRLDGVEEHLSGADRRLDGVDHRLDGIDQHLSGIDHRLDGIDEHLSGVDRRLDRMDDHLGALRGHSLEQRYRDHAGAYFGRLIRRIRLVGPDELDDLLEQGMASGVLDEEATHDVRLADVIARGRRPIDGQETYIVVEASAGVGTGDVERAARRAALLSRVRPTLAVVAGEWATSEAKERAREAGVWQVLDGQMVEPTAS